MGAVWWLLAFENGRYRRTGNVDGLLLLIPAIIGLPDQRHTLGLWGAAALIWLEYYLKSPNFFFFKI